MGNTPLGPLALPPGQVSLRLEHPGYRAGERTVMLLADSEQRVVVELPQAP